jgi:predicted permease
MVILNSIFPLFCLLALGCLLNRFKITTGQFFATSDRLVYYIFFPAMLFWKIG